MSDGFTVDFYKFIWKDIGAFVFRSLYFGYETGHFPEFQTRRKWTIPPVIVVCLLHSMADHEVIEETSSFTHESGFHKI
jgi:hypothetical protein